MREVGKPREVWQKMREDQLEKETYGNEIPAKTLFCTYINAGVCFVCFARLLINFT